MPSRSNSLTKAISMESRRSTPLTRPPLQIVADGTYCPSHGAFRDFRTLRNDFLCVKLIHCKGLTFLGCLEKGEELMGRYRFSLCLAVTLAAGLVYSGSQAWAQACAVGLNVHPHAWILLHHHRLTQCTGGAGCKCVSCTTWNGSVTSVCYPLAAPIPH
jgi:hypothetical protein